LKKEEKFLAVVCEEFETPQLFTKAYYNKTSTYSHLALLISSRNLQEDWWCKLFWVSGHSFGAKNSVFRVFIT